MAQAVSATPVVTSVHVQPTSSHRTVMWCASSGTTQVGEMQCEPPIACMTNESWQCSRSSLHQRQRTADSSATITETLPAGAVSCAGTDNCRLPAGTVSFMA
jgi:hypothetical protein